MDRTTSLGLWRYAKDYYDAGLLIAEQGNKLSAPCYYLFSHSIELALKAFLRAKGWNIEQIKKLGHNLEKNLKEAEKNSIAELWPVSEESRAIIRMLNVYYKSKMFEYMYSGMKTFPQIEVVVPLVDDLITKIHGYCLAQRKLHCGRSVATR